MDSISEKEFERNGYSVKQKTDSSGGALYSIAARGQNVRDEDTLKIDQTKKIEKNLSGSTFGLNQDLTEMPSTGQQMLMTGENALDKTAGIVGNIQRLWGAGKPSPQQDKDGNLPTPAEAPKQIETQKPTLYGPDNKPIN
jgi:hypothetical protein